MNFVEIVVQEDYKGELAQCRSVDFIVFVMYVGVLVATVLLISH